MSSYLQNTGIGLLHICLYQMICANGHSEGKAKAKLTNCTMPSRKLFIMCMKDE